MTFDMESWSRKNIGLIEIETKRKNMKLKDKKITPQCDMTTQEYGRTSEHLQSLMTIFG